MTTTVLVRKKGQLTIPVEMREKLGIEENEPVTVSLLGEKAVLIFPKKLKTDELLKESAEIAKKKGITMEEMIIEWDKIRHQL